MRNGLLLTLAALLVAVLPVTSQAGAPIFQKVPGVICIGHDGVAATATYTDVFALDAAVYDADNADSDLSWVFAENTAGLTVSGDVFYC